MKIKKLFFIIISFLLLTITPINAKDITIEQLNLGNLMITGENSINNIINGENYTFESSNRIKTYGTRFYSTTLIKGVYFRELSHV